VALIITAREKLQEAGFRTRVVSLASHELFALQSKEYQESVLPKDVPRVSIEAAHTMSWYRWVGSNGVVLGIDRYGASAPYETVYTELGLTVDKVVEAARSLVHA
jgi:transketolase